VAVRLPKPPPRPAAARLSTFRSPLPERSLLSLHVIELRLPPLRDRPEDIPYLTAAFIREFAGKFQKPIHGVRPAAERALIARRWLDPPEA
jgi:DNA-binding NtrC family response regulator